MQWPNFLLGTVWLLTSTAWLMTQTYDQLCCLETGLLLHRGAGGQTFCQGQPDSFIVFRLFTPIAVPSWDHRSVVRGSDWLETLLDLKKTLWNTVFLTLLLVVLMLPVTSAACGWKLTSLSSWKWGHVGLLGRWITRSGFRENINMLMV